MAEDEVDEVVGGGRVWDGGVLGGALREEDELREIVAGEAEAGGNVRVFLFAKIVDFYFGHNQSGFGGCDGGRELSVKL